MLFDRAESARHLDRATWYAVEAAVALIKVVDNQRKAGDNQSAIRHLVRGACEDCEDKDL